MVQFSVLIQSVCMMPPSLFESSVRMNWLSDGTTNFVHGFPFSCTSIGLINQKRPVLGVIYNPFIDWLVRYLKLCSDFRELTMPLDRMFCIVLRCQRAGIVPDQSRRNATETSHRISTPTPFSFSSLNGSRMGI